MDLCGFEVSLVYISSKMARAVERPRLKKTKAHAITLDIQLRDSLACVPAFILLHDGLRAIHQIDLSGEDHHVYK